ncbi:Rho guanine nucleotide exchange factor 8 [Linum perenne]
MVRAIDKDQQLSVSRSKSTTLRKMFEIPGRQIQNMFFDHGNNNNNNNSTDNNGSSNNDQEKPPQPPQQLQHQQSTKTTTTPPKLPKSNSIAKAGVERFTVNADGSSVNDQDKPPQPPQQLQHQKSTKTTTPPKLPKSNSVARVGVERFIVNADGSINNDQDKPPQPPQQLQHQQSIKTTTTPPKLPKSNSVARVGVERFIVNADGSSNNDQDKPSQPPQQLQHQQSTKTTTPNLPKSNSIARAGVERFTINADGLGDTLDDTPHAVEGSSTSESEKHVECGPPPKTPTHKEKGHSDLDLMKEKFAKLLLGEDMSGGGKGVSSALALSNAITNLAASVFGEQKRLEPMSTDAKGRWKKEIDWLLSVTEHIVEFVPSQQSNNGVNMEIMVTRQRSDLLMNIPALRKLDTILVELLDQFGKQNEFWYVSKSDDDSEKGGQGRNEDKWWIPTAKVPKNGLSEPTRRWLQSQKDAVNQVLKAAMAINALVLSEMDVPEEYIESLPKNGRSSLGDSIYKSITDEHFDPTQFLSAMDLSTEHKVLELKNRIEASIVIWKRKMIQKDGKAAWGSAVSIEKRELFEDRAETILLILKQHFPGLPQSSLDISKISNNRDVGQAILESYSRIIESLAYTVLSRIEDVLFADSTALNPPPPEPIEKLEEEVDKSSSTETPSTMTLSDFMGWTVDKGDNDLKKSTSSRNIEILDQEKGNVKPVATPKKSSYLERLENLSGLRSPTARH